MKVTEVFHRRAANGKPPSAHPTSAMIRHLGKDIVRDFLTFNVPHMAASIAFWGFFSIFPMVLAIVLLTSSFLSYDSFIETLSDNVPVSDKEFIRDTLEGVTENWPYTGLVSVIGLVWASLAVFSAVRKGMNAAWGVTRARPFFRERLIDFSLMMGAWLTFVASVAITPVLEFTRNAPHVGRFFTWEGYWELFRILLPLVLTTFVFMFLYRFVPNTQVRWRDVWVGALLAAVSFEVLRHGFVWYVGMFSVYHLVYGTAATMVVLLAWVYFSGVVLLFGAVVASRMNKLRRMRELNGSTHIASSHLDVDMLILTKTKDG